MQPKVSCLLCRQADLKGDVFDRVCADVADADVYVVNVDLASAL